MPEASPLTDPRAITHRLKFVADIFDGFTEGISYEWLRAGAQWALHGKVPASDEPDLISLFAAPHVAAEEAGAWFGDATAAAHDDLRRLNDEAMAAGDKVPTPLDAGVRERVRATIKSFADTKWPKGHGHGTAKWVDGLADSVVRALLAATEQRGESVWRPPSQVPDVKVGSDEYRIVAVRRGHNGRIYSIPAAYCNAKALDWSDDDDEREITGWYSPESEGEDVTSYHPLLGRNDELIAWAEVPQFAPRAAVQPPTPDETASLANALTKTGCRDEADLIDMANVGRSLLGEIASLVTSEGPFKGWAPADDPAEIVFDLASALNDETASLKARVEVLEGALTEIADLKPEPVADGFVQGPAVLLRHAQTVARATLSNGEG